MEPRPKQIDSSRKYLRILFFSAFIVTLLGIFVSSDCYGSEPTSPAKLTYIKVLKGSVPEYQAITVDANGVGTYDGRQLNESPEPRPLKLTASTTRALFALAESLGDFHALRLKSPRKVANLGLKTLIYTHDGQENKVEFNYTANRQAQALESLFDGIGSVEQYIDSLEYSARFDPLGLPGKLTQIEIDLKNKVLVDPQLMAPILRKIAGDSQYLHIAQARAVYLLHRIQKSK